MRKMMSKGDVAGGMRKKMSKGDVAGGMRKMMSKGNKIMSSLEIKNFIQHYERLTKHMRKHLGKKADTIVNIDKKHKLKSIKFN